MPSQTPYPVIRYESVSSTNGIALELARQGAPHGTVVLAQKQEHGRGRGEKYFASPTGGLYMSVILRPELEAERLSLITLAAGLASAMAIEELIEQKIDLKWPNDLYLQGRKVGGILAETCAYSNLHKTIPYVVLGIGINVNTLRSSYPPDLRNIITSLYDVHPKQYDLDALMAVIHSRLEALLNELREDPGRVLNDWQKRDYLLHREISWLDVRGGFMKGRGAGIRDDGCYLLRTGDGVLHPILAGEVSFGPIGNQRI